MQQEVISCSRCNRREGSLAKDPSREVCMNKDLRTVIDDFANDWSY